MNDTLDYFRTGPEYRSSNYHKLTFSMMYYYDARFLLPLSHDEVVHGKATILQKMNGDYDNKFPQARALYMYMYAHPGKKLNFMGNEFGQLREWDEKREQDWMLLDYPIHSGFARFMKDLNEIYLTHSALWEKDYQADGFRWIDCHQEQTCVYVLERSSKKEHLTAVFNFSDRSQTYELKLPGCQKIKELLNSDLEAYGGSLKRRRPARKITRRQISGRASCVFRNVLYCGITKSAKLPNPNKKLFPTEHKNVTALAFSCLQSKSCQTSLQQVITFFLLKAVRQLSVLLFYFPEIPATVKYIMGKVILLRIPLLPELRYHPRSRLRQFPHFPQRFRNPFTETTLLAGSVSL